MASQPRILKTWSLQRQHNGFFAARVQRLPHAAFDRRHGLVHPHQPGEPQRVGGKLMSSEMTTKNPMYTGIAPSR